MKKSLIVVCAAGLCLGALAEDAYVQANGTQAIDTGYFAKPTTQVEADFAYDALTQQQYAFGDKGEDAGLTIATYISGGNEYAWGFKDGNGDWLWTGIRASTDRVRLVMDGVSGEITLFTNGVSAATKSLSAKRTATAVYPFAIFAARAGLGIQDFSNYAKMKLYSLKISESGTLLHDYRPYSGNGLAGLKDVVTGEVLGPRIGSPLTVVGVTDETRVFTWTGAEDSDWAKPGNWLLGGDCPRAGADLLR